MDIHIAAGSRPVSFNSSDILIRVNSLTLVENDFTNYINLISDIRYFSKVKDLTVSPSNLSSPLFVTAECAPYLKNLNVVFEDVIEVTNLGRNGFSIDIDKGVYHGCSSVYIALQLAAYLNPLNIHVWGMSYSYGKSVSRIEGGTFQLPDPLISETMESIEKYVLPFFSKSSTSLFFHGSVF